MAAGTIFGEDIEDVTEDTFESQKDSKVQKIKSNTYLCTVDIFMNLAQG